ncbi:MAG: biotin--[acetyl-CoA-carboxylase] ligase [Pseudomonadota bacterium]
MKPLTFKILRALADGEFHSGEKIAQALEISRASVSLALQDVEEVGLQVHKVHGRGYRLARPMQWLDVEKIRAALGRHARHFDIEIMESAESTNTLLLQKAALDAPSGSVIAAEWQTHGRGRRGREWHAGLGGALMFSLLWRFPQGVGFLSGLGLAVGVALLRTLQKLGASDVQLKWPNDILWRHHKLGGILIELQGDALGPTAAVIGIGLNLNLPDSVRAKIDQAVSDVHSACGAPQERNAVFVMLLKELDKVLTLFAKEGFAPLRAEWRAHHAYQGKNVTLRLGDGSSEHGSVVGVAEDGALMLHTRTGTKRFHGGEISLRAAR